MIREDNSEKPVYRMLHKLIKEEWWTDTTIRTDENGFAVAEGFKGDYRLIHGNTEAELKLTAGLQKQEITLA